MSLARSVATGVLWTVGMRWAIRGIGVISLAILARLLVPEDFGLVAMTLAVTALTGVLLDFGTDVAIIRNKHAGESHFDTAWTVKILQAAAIALLVVALAHPVSGYLGDARIADLLMVAAFGLLLASFENVGIVLLRRDLDFRRDFIFNSTNRLVGALATIALALWLRSYWALILGSLVRTVVAVGFSYRLSAYRPRFSLAEWSEIWAFSKWNLVKGIATYCIDHLDRLVVGKLAGAGPVGVYNVGQEISTMATGELIGPLNRVLVPGLSKLNDDVTRLRDAFLRTQNVVVTVSLPTSLGLALVASELVPLFLGDGWLACIPVVQAFALFAASSALVSMAGNLLTISGHVRAAAVSRWMQALAFLALMYPAYQLGGLVGIALAKGVSGLLLFSVCAYLNERINGVALLDLWKVMWRALIAAAAMSILVYEAGELLEGSAIEVLTVKVLVGVVSYVGVLLVLWRACGMPQSVEWLALQALADARSRLLSRPRAGRP